jgi:hypothetical protein
MTINGENMHDLVRASDLADAHRKLMVAAEKVQEAMSDLGKWKIDFKFEIIPTNFDFRVTMNKGNGAGFIRTFTVQEVLYYKDDPQSFILLIAEMAFIKLLKDVIVNDISSSVTKSISNISRMTAVDGVK